MEGGGARWRGERGGGSIDFPRLFLAGILCLRGGGRFDGKGSPIVPSRLFLAEVLAFARMTV